MSFPPPPPGPPPSQQSVMSFPPPPTRPYPGQPQAGSFPPPPTAAYPGQPISSASSSGNPLSPVPTDPGRRPAKLLKGDPRSSSGQSLTPSFSEAEARRTLLIVYIHGFYGNDQSFRSFPAHVHSQLKEVLGETHVLHSKVYPRYKTYKAIEVARDNLSAWLEPHESPTTDIILVGHSMGGLLAAEIVLMPNTSPYRSYPFKHRILGTLSLDSPFLGLHPGIVVSGISSLFQGSPKPPEDGADLSATTSVSESLNLSPMDSRQSSISVSSSSLAADRRPADPYFDPPFWNDKPFREQPFFKRVMHFAKKHRSENMFTAVSNHLVSHLEFGGCLADYPGLSDRYKRLRALEDVDEIQALSDGHPGGAHARVRFVNYYTLSSGRPKPPKPADHPQEGEASGQADASAPASGNDSGHGDQTVGITTAGLPGDEQGVKGEDQPATDAVASSIHASGDGDREKPMATSTGQWDESDDKSAEMLMEELDSDFDSLSMQDVDPTPLDEPYEQEEDASQPVTESQEPDEKYQEPKGQTQNPEVSVPEPIAKIPSVSLPPIPDAPPEPVLPDLDQYTDKGARKQAERESKRLQKVYEQAVKDRAKAVKEREKLEERNRKIAQKEVERVEREALKERQRVERDEKKRVMREDWAKKQAVGAGRQQAAEELAAHAAADSAALTAPAGAAPDAAKTADAAAPAPGTEAARPKKRKKFCTLPSKVGGTRDPAWVDVYMDGMDEVGAHCGLFMPGPHYDVLIGDVVARVLGWVQDDLTKRAVLDMAREG